MAKTLIVPAETALAVNNAGLPYLCQIHAASGANVCIMFLVTSTDHPCVYAGARVMLLVSCDVDRNC